MEGTTTVEILKLDLVLNNEDEVQIIVKLKIGDIETTLELHTKYAKQRGFWYFYINYDDTNQVDTNQLDEPRETYYPNKRVIFDMNIKDFKEFITMELPFCSLDDSSNNPVDCPMELKLNKFSTNTNLCSQEIEYFHYKVYTKTMYNEELLRLEELEELERFLILLEEINRRDIMIVGRKIFDKKDYSEEEWKELLDRVKDFSKNIF